MKKMMLVSLVFVLAVTLAGCSDTPDIVNEGDIIYEFDSELYYTGDEVDELLREQATTFAEILYNNYVEYNDEDKLLYTNCVIIDGIKYCDIVLDMNQNYLVLTESEYQELLNRIEELENGAE